MPHLKSFPIYTQIKESVSQSTFGGSERSSNNVPVHKSEAPKKRTNPIPQIEVLKPNEKVRTDIQFIFNNLTPSTIEEKGAQLKELISPEYLNYLAHYIVVNRVCVSDKMHPVYIF